MLIGVFSFCYVSHWQSLHHIYIDCLIIMLNIPKVHVSVISGRPCIRSSDLWFLLPLNTSEHNYNAVTNWITIWQVNMKPADIVGHHRSGSFGVSTYPPRFRPTFSSRQFLSVRYQSENKYIGSNTFPPWKKMGTSVPHAPAPLHHCIVTKATKDTGEHD